MTTRLCMLRALIATEGVQFGDHIYILANWRQKGLTYLTSYNYALVQGN